ncbi:MAG: NAD(+)/NADH kinase [Clostridiales bacterium]|nr:NAD(+)/NADH kinase [Clostridiales bacterium]
MKKLAIAINPTKDAEYKILKIVKDKFQKAFNLEEVIVFNSFDSYKQQLNHDIDLILVLGGDGTFLNVAREMSKKVSIPLVGINMGNLGFLSGIEVGNIDEAIEKIKNKYYSIDKRILLNCTIGNKHNENAVNDVVVSRGILSRIVNFRIFVDNKLYTTFKGDGLIVSTPTGSTAYNFSAGGPIVYPNLDLITLTPICPHTKSMQPMVVNGNSVIEIIPENSREIHLTVDGQKVIKVLEKEKIRVTKANKNIKVLLFDDYDYFKVLRTKILNNSNE